MGWLLIAQKELNSLLIKLFRSRLISYKKYFSVFIFAGFRFFPAWQVQWDRFSLTLPLAGKLLCKNYAVTFLGTLSILLNSGVPLVKALELVQQVMTNSAQKNGLSEIIKLIPGIFNGQDHKLAGTGIKKRA